MPKIPNPVVQKLVDDGVISPLVVKYMNRRFTGRDQKSNAPKFDFRAGGQPICKFCRLKGHRWQSCESLRILWDVLTKAGYLRPLGCPTSKVSPTPAPSAPTAMKTKAAQVTKALCEDVNECWSADYNGVSPPVDLAAFAPPDVPMSLPDFAGRAMEACPTLPARI
jgi:hypothetical protein